MSGGQKRRYNLLLNVRVGDALKGEARTRMMSVSALLEELLSQALNVERREQRQAEEGSQRSSSRISRRYRVSLNGVILERLAAEAGRRGVSVVRVIRDLLSQSLFGQGSVAREATTAQPSGEQEGGPGGPATLGLDVKGGDF